MADTYRSSKRKSSSVASLPGDAVTLRLPHGYPDIPSQDGTSKAVLAKLRAEVAVESKLASQIQRANGTVTVFARACLQTKSGPSQRRKLHSRKVLPSITVGGCSLEWLLSCC